MSEENVETVQRFLDHYKDTAEFLWDLIDPDVVWTVDPPAFLAGIYRSHDGMRALLRGLAEVFEEVRFEVEELIGTYAITEKGRPCSRRPSAHTG